MAGDGLQIGPTDGGVLPEQSMVHVGNQESGDSLHGQVLRYLDFFASLTPESITANTNQNTTMTLG